MENSVAPWGQPPTPLLPTSFLTLLDAQPLPAALSRARRELGTFSDLARFWEIFEGPLHGWQKDELVEAVQKILPNLSSAVVVSAGVTSEQLVSLPIRVRTANAIRRSTIFPNAHPITAGDLLQLPNFGIRSLIDVACVAEAAGLSKGELGPADSSHHDVAHGSTTSWAPSDAFLNDLLPALALARDTLGVRSVADALGSPRLTEALECTGALESFRELSLEELPKQIGPLAGLIDAVRLAEAEGDGSLADIFLRHKIHRTETLEALGKERGVTRERVRQLEKRFSEMLTRQGRNHAEAIAAMLKAELPPITSSDAVHERIEEVVQSASSSRSDTLDSSTLDLAKYLLEEQLSLHTKGTLALSDEGLLAEERLQQLIESHADDVGLVDLGEIVTYADLGFELEMQDLASLLGLVRIGRYFAIRDSNRARVKVALLEIGRSATKEEIAERADVQGRVGSTLSAIHSIVRASRTEWGLREWIDDVYEGIPAEIQQRIDEHGGAVSREFLLQDIPQRFDVTEASVKAYISSPQFEVNDGFVSLASLSSISYRPLEDVALRSEDGELTWEFKMEARYLDGYSIVNFPRELARELDCPPNGRSEIPVSSPEGCEPVSVVWRLANVSGAAEVGHVRSALQALGAKADAKVQLIIASDRKSVRFVIGESLPSPSPLSSGDALLERLQNRRRIL